MLISFEPRYRPHFFSYRCDSQTVNLRAVRHGLGIDIVMAPLARRMPELVPMLAGLALPVWPVGLMAHRELRASLRLGFDFLADALACWGDGVRPTRAAGGALGPFRPL